MSNEEENGENSLNDYSFYLSWQLHCEKKKIRNTF